MHQTIPRLKNTVIMFIIEQYNVDLRSRDFENKTKYFKILNSKTIVSDFYQKTKHLRKSKYYDIT